MPSPPGPQTKQTGWRFWTLRIAAAILIPVALLALTEGALRLFSVGYSTSLMVALHHPWAAFLLLQSFLLGSLLSSGNDQNASIFFYRPRQACSHLPYFCPWGIRGHGRSRSRLQFQPLPRSHAA